MRWHGATTLALASQGLLGTAWAQVTTVTEYATCGAVYTSGSQTVTLLQSTTTIEPTLSGDVSANSGTSFVIAVNTADSSRKRQATKAWIAPSGNTTTNGTQAALFTLTNGSLSAGAGVISTSEGVNFKIFASAATVGNISRTFSISNGALSWSNSAFIGGTATFYKTPSDLVAGAEVIASFAGDIDPSWTSITLTPESDSSALSVGSANVTQSTSVATNIIVSSTSITTDASGPSGPGSSSPGTVGTTATNSAGATVVTGSPGAFTVSTGIAMSIPPSSYGTGIVHLNGSSSRSSSSALPTISTPGQPIGPDQISIVANVSSSPIAVFSTRGSMTYTFTPMTIVSSSAIASPSLLVSGSVTYMLSAPSSAASTSSSSSSTAAPSSGSSTRSSASSTSSISSSRSSASSSTTSPASSTTPFTSTTTVVVTSTSTTTTSQQLTSSHLALPTPTACGFGDPPTTDQDDSYCTINLPFTMDVYSKSDTHLYASTNGYLSILNGSQEYQVTTLPDRHIPANTIAPLFEDLYLYANATPAQGIFYQFDSSGVNGTFEYYIGSAAGGWSASAYHFTVAYSTARAGVFNITYYNVPDSGANAAVGIQGVGPSGSEVAYTYSYRGTQNIAANLRLTCDTTSGSGSCVAS